MYLPEKVCDDGYVIFDPSTTFLGRSYGQIVVAVFSEDEIFTHTQRRFCNRQKSEENVPGAPVLTFFEQISFQNYTLHSKNSETL